MKSRKQKDLMEEINQSKEKKIWFLPLKVLSLIQLYASYALVHTTCHHLMIGITLHVIQMIQTYATTANHRHVYVLSIFVSYLVLLI